MNFLLTKETFQEPPISIKLPFKPVEFFQATGQKQEAKDEPSSYVGSESL